MMCMAILLSLLPSTTFARCVAKISLVAQGDPNCKIIHHLLSLQMALNLSELSRGELFAACHTAGLSAENSDDEMSLLGT